MGMTGAQEIGLGIGSLLTGGIASLVGSYWQGEISEKQFKKEMAFKNRELNERIRMEAARLGIDEAKMKQDWQSFVTELGEKRREFNLSYGLQKEDLKHKKFMDIINPIAQKNERAKNLIQAFSAQKKGGIATTAATPANPLTAPSTGAGFAPSSVATNPLTVQA